MLLEEDHVVPDQWMPGQPLSLSNHFLQPDVLTKAHVDTCQTDDSALWAEIEDVLELSSVTESQVTTEVSLSGVTESQVTTDVSLLTSQTTHAHTPNKRPDVLKLELTQQTPDFSLLMNTETPEESSPRAHEVPLPCVSSTSEGSRHRAVSLTLQSGYTTTTKSQPYQQNRQTTHDVIPTSLISSRSLTPLSNQQQYSCSTAENTQSLTDLISSYQSSVCATSVVQTSVCATSEVQTSVCATSEVQSSTCTTSEVRSSDCATSQVQSAESGTSGFGLMESLSHIRSSMMPDYGSFDVYSGMEVMEDTDAFMQGGTSGVVLEERIRHACTWLDIPPDPNSWTVDQVQTWAKSVLKSYDGRFIDPDVITSLTVDGATLTTMTKEDLINYFPSIGETLYNELEVWCFGLTSPFSNALVPQSQAEPAYIDLDNLAKNTYHDISMTSSVMPSLQPITPASMMMTSHPSAASPGQDSLLLPSVCSLMPCHATIKQENPDIINPIYIKQELISNHEHLSGVHHRCVSDLSPVSSPECGFPAFGSISCSPGSTSSGHSSHGEIFDDHQMTRHMLPPRSHAGKHTIQLWQFLKDLLLQPQYETYIRWLDRGKGIFKIEDSAHVAKLWGRRKNRPAMNYDKLSRSIRQYYKKGIIKKTSQSKRLVYQFCPQYNG